MNQAYFFKNLLRRRIKAAAIEASRHGQILSEENAPDAKARPKQGAQDGKEQDGSGEWS